MPSAEPTRLTDDLWLAAHDSVNGRRQIGVWPLGVGLATGLLAELVHGGFLELRQGELFRTAARPCDDPALRPLLVKMEAEELDWAPAPQQPPVRAHAQARLDVAAREGYDWPPLVNDGRPWPPPHDGWDWPLPARDDWSRRAPLVQEDTRHRKRDHHLGTWMSYLAYERRAEARVIDRLSRTGRVKRQERRRLLGGTTATYMPYDSVAAATPASLISIAVRNRRALSASELVLAGLFLATGLHHHALATLTPAERTQLAAQLGRRLDDPSRELLRAVDAAVGEAAMR